MIKKFLATTAVAASIVGVSAMAAPQAMAVGDGRGTSTANGNGAGQAFGNSDTITNVQNIVALINIGVQDILSSDQNQQCVENSTESQGDQALSHIIDKLPLLSENGVNNS